MLGEAKKRKILEESTIKEIPTININIRKDADTTNIERKFYSKEDAELFHKALLKLVHDYELNRGVYYGI